jgi:cell division septum initiation protein DivIVA
VAIAEVIARARQHHRISGMHGRYCLARSLHFDDAAVVRQQQIAMTQHRAALEEQTGLFTVVEQGKKAALGALTERQYQSAFGSALPGHGSIQLAVDLEHDAGVKKESNAAPAATPWPVHTASSSPSARTS